MPSHLQKAVFAALQLLFVLPDPVAPLVHRTAPHTACQHWTVCRNGSMGSHHASLAGNTRGKRRVELTYYLHETFNQKSVWGPGCLMGEFKI